MSEKQYCVYIMTNAHHTVLYTGVTNNLQRRVLEHQAGKSGFTKKYNVTKLVFFECGDDVNVAIAREKQIKGGSRKKKLDLINRINPEWKDLYKEYFGDCVTTGDSEAVSSNIVGIAHRTGTRCKCRAKNKSALPRDHRDDVAMTRQTMTR